jgi:hypothetical protein
MSLRVTSEGRKAHTVLWLSTGLWLCSCEGLPGEEGQASGSDIEVTQNALGITSYTDSLDGVNIQVKVCRSDAPVKVQTIACSVDVGYALIGGGAYAEQAGTGAMITESRPVDNFTWQASSADDVTSSAHYLNVYAVGMRLDGVNSQVLRSMIDRSASNPSAKATQPSYSYTVGSGMLGGGAATSVSSGAHEFLTKSVSNGATKWDVAARGSTSSTQGTITDYFTWWNKVGTIVEGFGALNIKQKYGSAVTVNSGIAKATVGVDSGYVIAGYGGNATTTSGQGRMLFEMGMDPANIRNAIVQSRDHSGSNSKGATTAYISEVAHVANSHGLCNAGPALTTKIDPCAAKVCASDPYCCSTYWDEVCVGDVPTYCSGYSCADYTCDLPSYNGDFWNNNPNPLVIQDNNCYSYANNKELGSITGKCAQPGDGSGQACDWINDLVNGLSKLAECAKRDGLIAVPTANCPSPFMDLLVLMVQDADTYYNTWHDYHWLRRDATGPYWSQKLSCGGAVTNMDENLDPEQPISDPIATATRGGYPNFVGYFCTCSSSTEGQGHAVIY